MTILRFIFCCMVVTLAGCESQQHYDDRVVHQYCASCHAFPEPSLLDKKTWAEHVLPQMAFRMGFDDPNLLATIPIKDLETVIRALPPTPIATTEEWQAIQRYYREHAPDTLALPDEESTELITGFKPLLPELKVNAGSFVTSITVDTLNDKIYLGTRQAKLFIFDNNFNPLDSIALTSPPSRILVDGDRILVTLMGVMDPNDQAAGSLVSLTLSNHHATVLSDSLKRPVYFDKSDLNGDSREDFVVCNFGNYTGNLQVLEATSDNVFVKHTISGLPGSRKIILKDFTNDGKIDILALFAQGDEHVGLFVNEGNFNFTERVLVRFPPVYGSSYFDIVDFNGDGYWDILTTNGDNMDYSIVLKPYHGIRLFLNDGKMNFKESLFLPVNGASMAKAGDFDHDGDIDIAAIAFFPDFTRHPEEGFVYFENKANNTFARKSIQEAAQSRWLIMDTGDFDHDGDADLFLGALNFPTSVADINKKWNAKPLTLLVLENGGASPKPIQ